MNLGTAKVHRGRARSRLTPEEPKVGRHYRLSEAVIRGGTAELPGRNRPPPGIEAFQVEALERHRAGGVPRPKDCEGSETQEIGFGVERDADDDAGDEWASAGESRREFTDVGRTQTVVHDHKFVARRCQCRSHAVGDGVARLRGELLVLQK